MESKQRKESMYKRDLSKEYFRPLKSYNYNPNLANNKQIELAESLSKDYGIPEGNILRLIMYAGIAWRYATDSEIQFYYSDMTEIGEFEKEPEPINEIFFRGDNKSILITNPFLIDELFHSMLCFMDFQKVLKDRRMDTKKKRPSENIVKLIATEIYNELTRIEKIEPWSSLYVTGFIFGLYNIGIKKGEFIKDEKQYQEYRTEQKKLFKITLVNYRQYLANHMKGLIIY